MHYSKVKVVWTCPILKDTDFTSKVEFEYLSEKYALQSEEQFSDVLVNIGDNGYSIGLHLNEEVFLALSAARYLWEGLIKNHGFEPEEDYGDVNDQEELDVNQRIIDGITPFMGRKDYETVDKALKMSCDKGLIESYNIKFPSINANDPLGTATITISIKPLAANHITTIFNVDNL